MCGWQRFHTAPPGAPVLPSAWGRSQVSANPLRRVLTGSTRPARLGSAALGPGCGGTVQCGDPPPPRRVLGTSERGRSDCCFHSHRWDGKPWCSRSLPAQSCAAPGAGSITCPHELPHLCQEDSGSSTLLGYPERVQTGCPAREIPASPFCWD